MSDEAKAIVTKQNPTEEDAAELRRLLLEHARDIAGRYKGRVEEWDVINEHFTQNAISQVTHRADPLRDPLMVELLQVVHETDPDARLFVNDYGILQGDKAENKDAYEQFIGFLLENDAPLGGIGMQCHFYHGDLRRTPEQMLATLDRFAQFELPIQITEFDTYGDGWGETPEQIEHAQADYLRQFYKVAFSHPAVNGITMWGFWDGQHWADNAPLFRRDWSPKPGFDAYVGLVFGEWKTDLKLTPDADHTVRFRGFTGHYRITVGDTPYTVELTPDNPHADLHVE